MKILPVALRLAAFGLLACHTSYAAVTVVPPQFTDMDFAALVNDDQASIIHMDGQGHAIVEPLDFLKGHAVLGWAMANLDQVVTCELNAANSTELEFKYYQHLVLQQTFRFPVTSNLQLHAPIWMFLLPEKNCLLFKPWAQSANILIRIDLTTGARKELTITSKLKGQSPTGIVENPLWDSKHGNLIVAVEENVPNRNSTQPFWARLDSDDASLKGETPWEEGPLVYDADVSQLLYYDQASDDVIFYGVWGNMATVLLNGGAPSFNTMPLNSGHPKVLMEEIGMQPYQPMISTNYIAIINRRYVVMTRVIHNPRLGDGDPRTFLIDLQNHGVQMLDMPYVTWPISQDGLHIDNPPKSDQP